MMKNNDKTQDNSSNKTFQAVKHLLTIKETCKNNVDVRDAEYSDKTRNIAVTVDVDDLYHANFQHQHLITNCKRKEPKPVAFQLAKFALKKKQFSTSYFYILKAIKIQDSLEAQIIRLQCLMELEKYLEVFDGTDELLETYPDSIDMLYLKAVSGYFLEKYEVALKVFHQGYRKSPKHKQPLFKSGIRRSEERIAEHLNRDSHTLFDLTNPIFFDKNILFENYSNLRRHLQSESRNSAANEFCDKFKFDVQIQSSRFHTYINIWLQKSLKFRSRKHLSKAETEK